MFHGSLSDVVDYPWSAAARLKEQLLGLRLQHIAVDSLEQAESMLRPILGPSAALVFALALLYGNPLATAQNGTTFGFSAQWGARVAGSIGNASSVR